MGSLFTTGVGLHDVRATASLAVASTEVADTWRGLMELTGGDLPPTGLHAGDQPSADVEVLAGGLAALEYELARRMAAADASGSLPLPGPGAMLAARSWSVGWARRLARAGGFAADHTSVAGAWAAGLITSEHVDAVVRSVGPLRPQELEAVLAELTPFWGTWSPAAVARFVTAAARMLHPPGEDRATPEEGAAHAGRGLSFSVLGDTVLLSGELPRLEGEVVMAAIEAFAERLRTEADSVPAAARRADALVELVSAAHAREALPTRGGLPVSLTVTLETTPCGDPVWSTSRGHLLTPGEQRFASCDAALTPILVEDPRCPDDAAALFGPASVLGPDRSAPQQPTPGARVAALATLMAEPRLPLAVGRAARTATPAQRRAAAARDRGCVIPGCRIPAEACQVHHVREWADGGRTDLSNLATLCWTHHRQVDLRMWEIRPGRPDGLPDPIMGPVPGRQWPGNNGSPWTISPQPRSRWRT